MTPPPPSNTAKALRSSTPRGGAAHSLATPQHLPPKAEAPPSPATAEPRQTPTPPPPPPPDALPDWDNTFWCHLTTVADASEDHPKLHIMVWHTATNRPIAWIARRLHPDPLVIADVDSEGSCHRLEVWSLAHLSRGEVEESLEQHVCVHSGGGRAGGSWGGGGAAGTRKRARSVGDEGRSGKRGGVSWVTTSEERVFRR